ncbi:MAG: DSD1 family PLP-dependent enzyme [Gammaproteobacteria bacterium]|nr:DSD1 family PLP-dependent enzyme [Gammaproteobacteria bacterium]
MATSKNALPLHLQELQTPCLLLVERAFNANLEKMARHCAERRIHLRPHAKTHKSAAVAQAQINRGAGGVCCATLAEAELLADAVDSILLTSPFALDRHFARLLALNGRLNELICVVDHPKAVAQSEKFFTAANPLDVYLDLDPGRHRTGSVIGAEAIELAHRLHEAPHLNFRGIQCYAGHLMHVSSLKERQERVDDIWATVAAFKHELERQGVPCSTVSGGGTGSHDIDWRSNIATELQAGSYPFMDIEYASIGWPEAKLPFEQSLFVLTTVVSANTPGFATTDAGLKAFATDSVPPEVLAGLAHLARYVFQGDEHGGLVFESPHVEAVTGTQLLVTPPHCDPTINLYDHMFLVDESFEIKQSFEITARSGRQYRNV